MLGAHAQRRRGAVGWRPRARTLAEGASHVASARPVLACPVLLLAAYAAYLALTSTRRAANAPYVLSPLPQSFGAEVVGVDLNGEVGADAVERLRADVLRHRLLLFRNQREISPVRHAAIGRWFGELARDFPRSPKNPHRHVFRVSNDAREGATEFGNFWHVDSVYAPLPHAFQLTHMVHVPTRGRPGTQFLPLAEAVLSLPPEQRRRWERLAQRMRSDPDDGNPLVYSHPVTGNLTMCVSMAFEDFIWDLGSQQQRLATREEAGQVRRELLQLFDHDMRGLVYTHRWREGDFVIADNRALVHRVEPVEQGGGSVDAVGLRVLHRVTVQGTLPARKNYRLDAEGNPLPP